MLLHMYNLNSMLTVAFVTGGLPPPSSIAPPVTSPRGVKRSRSPEQFAEIPVGSGEAVGDGM